MQQKRAYKFLCKLIEDNISGASISGCEVGVWKGHLSEYLLATFSNLNLLMVDNYQPGETNSSSKKIDIQEALIEACGRTDMFAARRVMIITQSEKATDLVPDNSLDFVYIDADHTEEGVRTDLEAWYSKVKSGGIVSGHDYNGRGDKSGRFGVKKAVDEFAEKYGYEVMSGHYLVWWFIKK